ncbi:MAG: 50S ribosomal protein L11 methyltransferase, partial [Kiritimatiellae bacterium]|nr:50S ribosomal protein L11 methyltransferase [Kiritimatiellia bacterium]
TEPRQVVDLYCGVGVFALAASRAGIPVVWGIDHDRQAIRSALQNCKRLSLHDVQFECAPVATGLRKLYPALQPQQAAIIVDPPRTGLDRKTIEAITALRPAHVIYVSCAADTLARDIALLAVAGYRLEQARIVDMFPRTAYFETVALLSAT